MSIVFMDLSAGLVVAPALATLIGEAFGWRTAFMAAAACGLLALLMQAVCLPHVPCRIWRHVAVAGDCRSWSVGAQRPLPFDLCLSASWGIAVGAGPVMTQRWMGRAAPDQLEGVGGLFLAVTQLGVTFGAIADGIAVDAFGTSAPLYVTAVSAVLAAVPIAGQRSRGVDPRRVTSELGSSE